MNYIEQIRGFWWAHEEHSFNTTEVAVYFYLLEVCNICHWKNPFKRNNAKIGADLGVSFNTLKNARNRLAQVGLISFKTTNGSPNVVYTLSKFDKVTNEVSVEVAVEVTNEVGVEVTDEIIKTETKTKLNETNPPPPPKLGGEGAEESFSEPPNAGCGKRKKLRKKRKAEPLCFDFVADDFREAFLRFIDYRVKKRRPYSTQQGIETAYKKLLEYSNRDPVVAAKVVEQSIANEWQGLFELKTQTNGAKKTINPRLSVGGQDYGESTI
jgi:hypothetical protein